jgi:glycosyltransferase involved in cell wall biosynthesis
MKAWAQLMQSNSTSLFSPSSCPKIGIVSASLSRNAGGILPIMIGHAIELRSLGANVLAYGVEDHFTELDSNQWQGIQLSTYLSFEHRTCFAPALSRALANANLDIVHQHGLWLYPSIAVSRWRQRQKRPVVISTHGMLEPWAIKNSKLKKQIAALLFERHNLSEATCLHCSESEVAGLRDFGLKNPIAVLPNGTWIPKVDERQIPEPVWVQEPDRRRILLFLGRLHPKKGLSETLKAWALLKVSKPELFSAWRLAIAGWDDGGHEIHLKTLVQHLGLHPSDVVFLGSLFGSEKEAAWTHADAFVLASHSEGLPMSVLEAWAHSLPVFKTRACNIPEGFDRKAAIEISTDPREIAEVFAAHLGSMDLQAFGQRGRYLVQEKYSWPAIGSGLMDVYKWLLGEAKMPDSVLIDR